MLQTIIVLIFVWIFWFFLKLTHWPTKVIIKTLIEKCEKTRLNNFRLVPNSRCLFLSLILIFTLFFLELSIVAKFNQLIDNFDQKFSIQMLIVPQVLKMVFTLPVHKIQLNSRKIVLLSLVSLPIQICASVLIFIKANPYKWHHISDALAYSLMLIPNDATFSARYFKITNSY